VKCRRCQHEKEAREVLRGVCRAAGLGLRQVRAASVSDREVLPRVCAPDRAGAGASSASRIRCSRVLHAQAPRREDPHLPGRPRGRTQAGHGAVRRPEGLDGSLPLSVVAKHWLAWCLAQLGRFPDGVARAEQALRIAESIMRTLSGHLPTLQSRRRPSPGETVATAPGGCVDEAIPRCRRRSASAARLAGSPRGSTQRPWWAGAPRTGGVRAAPADRPRGQATCSEQE
jgi:hypothetical protein